MTTLYEKIGGDAAIDAAVELFYRKVLVDDRVSRFFDDTDMNGQLKKQKAFLTMVFGGPAAYAGKDLKSAHAPLVAGGLNDEHFNAVGEHLVATLRELSVAEELIAEVGTVVETTRDAVLGRS